MPNLKIPFGYGLPFRTRVRLYFHYKLSVKKWTNILIFVGIVPFFLYYGTRIYIWSAALFSFLDIFVFTIPFFAMGFAGMLWLVKGQMYSPLYGYIIGIQARINGFINFIIGFGIAFYALYFAIFYLH